MALQKKKYSKTTLSDLSAGIMSRLEQTEMFRAASCVALYHALPGEVQTAEFIEKWYRKKQLLLPVVQGDDLELRLYTGSKAVKAGPFGILEPAEKSPVEHTIDLMIVPGVAFDRQKNRLGRGKGYYDRLLTSVTAPKLGICFSFQLFDRIPVEPFDQKMDLILTEDESVL